MAAKGKGKVKDKGQDRDRRRKTLAKYRSTQDFHTSVACVIDDGLADFGATLVFLRNRAAVSGLSAILSEMSVSHESIDHRTPSKQQRRILDDYKAGNIRVLLNCGMLSEGFGNTIIERIILAAVSRSWLSIIQHIGRARRPSGSKKIAQVVSMLEDLKPEDLDRPPNLELAQR